MTARTDTFDRICQRVHELAADHRELQPADTDLTKCAPDFRLAVQRLMDAKPGLPGAQTFTPPSGDAGRVDDCEEPATGHHDPTGDRGISGDATARDVHHLDRLLRQLEADSTPIAVEVNPKALPRIVKNAWALRRMVQVWTPKAPTAKDRREVSAHNAAATECAQTRTALGLYASVHCVSDLKGLLPEPEPVCLWLWRFARSRRRLPTPMEWNHHRSTDDDLRSQATQIALGATRKMNPPPAGH